MNEAQVAQVAQQIEPQVAPINDVIELLNRAKEKGEICAMYHGRLYAILEKLYEYEKNGLITFKQTYTTEITNWCSINAVNCILNFSELTINDPDEFCKRINKMVTEDQRNIWKLADEKPKNPTWIVYKLFRRFGLSPHSRGPNETVLNKKDMLYYKKWFFINDEHFFYKR